MLNINLDSKLSGTITGLLIFFVPFFTYLSPENLKQLDGSDVLEIFLLLLLILIVIFISSLSVEILIKRFFNKKIILFPLVCFSFYLNFLYSPIAYPIQEFLLPKFGENLGSTIFIFFELFCLLIIVFGAKFKTFSTRVILIFSVFMLINAFIPLVGYLAQNIGKNPTISYEIKNMPLAQDEVLKKRNVYYVLLDGMLAIDPAEEINIVSKKETLTNLSNVGLRYIDKSQSSYNYTSLTITSIMLMDYHQIKKMDRTGLYPRIMFKNQAEVPLISYLIKANSSIFWSGKNFGTCIPSSEWFCVGLSDAFVSNNLFKFSLSTPFPKILRRFFSGSSQDSIGPFLEYIDTRGLPNTLFFAYIHHDSPHNPYLVTRECEPAKYLNQNFQGYKASYLCTLKTVQIFMEKINNVDPDAIVIFQGDHGSIDLEIGLTEKEKHLFLGKIFNAIKAPEVCFEKYGLPKTNVNTIRFALNCAYGFNLPYRKDIHYSQTDGVITERVIYD
jgi:hypothetical protein